MSEPERPTCATCPYWSSFGTSRTDGTCQVDSPKALCEKLAGGDLLFTGSWPETTYEDWCGRHPDFPLYIIAVKASIPEYRP